MKKKKKMKPKYGTVKCAWCGLIVALSNKKRAMPHNNGAQRCCGSGHHAHAHNDLLLK